MQEKVLKETINVRRFRDRDLNSLRRIYLESRRMAFHWLDGESLTLRDFDAATKGETVWVAESSLGILGFASVWESEKFLHNLFVHPAHVGCGVGSALLDACLENLGRPVSLKCIKRNRKALAFYQKRGWVIQGEGDGADGPYYLMNMLR